MRNNAGILVVLFVVLAACKAKQVAQGVPASTVFSRGEQSNSPNFTGTVWLNMLVKADTAFDINTGQVTFAAGARTNWHSHPGGQVLLITAGEGLVQEKGQPARRVRAGEVIQCSAGVIHWHGATRSTGMTHLAIGTRQHKGPVVWLAPVSDAEYAAAEQNSR